MGAIGSYFLMLVGRVVRGTAEGPLFPVANRYIRFWFPLSERGGANAIWTSGQRVGMTLAVPLLSVAIGMWGWRSAFFLQAVFVLILVVPSIWFLTADAPEDMVGIGATERNYIIEGRTIEKGKGEGKKSGDLSSLLHNYRFWLMVAYHFSVLAILLGADHMAAQIFARSARTSMWDRWFSLPRFLTWVLSFRPWCSAFCRTASATALRFAR